MHVKVNCPAWAGSKHGGKLFDNDGIYEHTVTDAQFAGLRLRLIGSSLRFTLYVDNILLLERECAGNLIGLRAVPEATIRAVDASKLDTSYGYVKRGARFDVSDSLNLWALRKADPAAHVLVLYEQDMPEPQAMVSLQRLDIRSDPTGENNPKPLGVSFNAAGFWVHKNLGGEAIKRALAVMDASGLAYSYRLGVDGSWVDNNPSSERVEVYCSLPPSDILDTSFNEAGFWVRDCSEKMLVEALAIMDKSGLTYSYKVGNGSWNGPPPPVSLQPLVTTEKQDYATGAERGSSEGRGRYDLISDRFLRRLAIHLEKGAEHYAPRNWEKGLPLARSFGSMIRHAYQWLRGAKDEDHLAAVACNIMFLIHTEELILEGLLPLELLDELPACHNTGAEDGSEENTDA